MNHLAPGFAGAVGGYAREGGDAAEAARQVLPDLFLLRSIEALPFVVGHRQKDFNEVHGRPRGPWIGMSWSTVAAPLAGLCSQTWRDALVIR
jgi:hypothetical protein